MAHRISIGVLCLLPLASRIAILVLVDFISELRVTCISLSQEAVGERGLPLLRRNGTGPATLAILHCQEAPRAWKDTSSLLA